jgi:NitT/TauT family transport system substrate-binding protein
MAKIHIMALRHSAFYSPLLMTMAGGFLRQQGLDYDYSVATPERSVAESLRDGSCQVAQSAVATSFVHAAPAPETDIVHFAQINGRDGFFIAAREPDADFRWDKLQGKQVLVDHFFQPLAMLKYGLHRQGVAFDDLKVIDAGDVQAMDRAFRDGVGDYVHQQGPAPQQMEKDGVGYVVARVGDAVGPVAFSSLCATREWLQSDMARAFMAAYRQALQFVTTAPAEEIAAKEYEAGLFPHIDQEVLAQTVQAYQQLGCWSEDPSISPQSYDNLLAVFLHSGLISERVPYSRFIVAPPA